MTTVTIHQAKTHLSRLLAEVEAGHEVIIARGATAIAKLVPLDPAGRRTPGVWKGKLAIRDDAFAPLTDDELTGWQSGNA